MHQKWKHDWNEEFKCESLLSRMSNETERSNTCDGQGVLLQSVKCEVHTPWVRLTITTMSQLAFLVHKFLTQPLLLGATALFRRSPIKFKSLTGGNSCNRGKETRAEETREGGRSRERGLGPAMAVLSLVVVPFNHWSVALKKHTLLLQSAEEGLDSCFVDYDLMLFTKWVGRSSPLKTWQVRPSGCLLGMCPHTMC